MLVRAIRLNLSLAPDAPEEEVESRLSAMPFDERVELLETLEQELFDPVS